MAPADLATTAEVTLSSTRRELEGLMGCRGSVTIVGIDDEAAHKETSHKRLLTVAEWRLRELESRWSRFLPDSEITALARADGEPLAVSEPTRQLVRHLVEAWDATDGSFDPRRLPELVALGYASSVLVPARTTTIRSDAVSDYDLREIEIDEDSGTVRLPRGATLDPGGLGKGLAADLVVAELIDRGAHGAMVEIGGDLRVAGEAPSGSGWRIDVENPRESAAPLDTLLLADGGVATSTRLRRRWGTDAALHHLLDPRSGRASVSNVLTATVVSATGAWSEAFTKVPLVLGSDDAIGVLEAEGIAALLTLTNGDVLTTGPWNAVRANDDESFAPDSW